MNEMTPPKTGNSTATSHLEVRNPVAFARVAKTVLAPRLKTLDKKRVALWWNGKAGGDIALNRIGEMLREKFTSIQLEMIHTATTAGKEHLEQGKTYDAVIGATAD